MNKFINTLFAIGFYCVIHTQIAYGYIDPGTGSLYLQLVASVVLGLLFSLKMSWKKVKTIPKRLFHKDKESDRKET